jgi:proteasome inhibitor subunit 1 (PI31)
VKPGYAEETTARSGGNSGNIGGNAPPPSAGPSQPRPQPLRPDNETDPGRIGAPPNFPRPGFGQNPLEIGRSDLDPLGGAVGRLPGAGGDGMFVGPNHPLFGREQEQQNPLGGGNGQRGPWGGDGYLPPLGAPPGARFDPITPFGLGGNRPNQPNQRNWGDEFPPPVSRN